jgi:RNA polymerase sigma-70 factor (ECF subfamily)
MLPQTVAMTVRDGKLCAVWAITNPDKFTGSPLRTQPTEHDRHHRN